jgi:hypothetical protein
MNFDDYYAFYLSRHQNRWCRRFHLLGQIATWSFVAIVLFHTFVISYWLAFLLLLAPFVVYPFAVSGHLFEGQLPAFFSSNPLKAKLADLRMCWDMLRGRIPF